MYRIRVKRARSVTPLRAYQGDNGWSGGPAGRNMFELLLPLVWTRSAERLARLLCILTSTPDYSTLP